MDFARVKVTWPSPQTSLGRAQGATAATEYEARVAEYGETGAGTMATFAVARC